MKVSNSYLKSDGTCFQRKIRRWSMLLVALFAFVVIGFSQSYPFPQNYQYPYGEIVTGSNVSSTVQSLYSAWDNEYYESGTMTGGSMSGQPAGRIKFIQNGESGGNSVSEGIAYGMLIYVYMDNATNNTQDKFDRLWTYYQGNSDNQGFMNWKVSGFTGTVAGGGYNEHGATDADLDVAAALMMAYKQWGDASYLADAKDMISRIWSNEVDQATMLLKPGNAFNDYVNACYFITNELELFKQVNTSNWDAVISACYANMKITANASTGLIPDWNYHDGSYISGIIDSKFESYFLYDAVRIPWRMAHAYAWYGHQDAKDIASKITTWGIGKFNGNPANAKDGYNLDGTAFNSSVPGFTELGKYSNPCFTGGMGIGSMVDNTTPFNSFRNNTWIEGSKADAYGKYYTETTQLLYMMTLTGNMPNFWDMKPVLETAQTDANGSQIILDFTKNLSTSGLSSATSNFTVSTYADDTYTSPVNIAVSSITRNTTDNSIITLNLASDISNPYIRITYNGSAIVALEDNAPVEPFGPVDVLNKITNMEPYPISRITNVAGTQIIIQWSKEINITAASAGNFTISVAGSPVTVTGISLDTDPTYLLLEIDGGQITSVNEEVKVSYIGGTITGISGTKTSKAFTNAPVQNFYLSQTCDVLVDFDSGNPAGFTAWAGTFNDNADDPVLGAANKCMHYDESTTTEAYAGIKQEAQADPDALGMSALVANQMTTAMRNNARIKMRYYVVTPPDDNTIRVTISEKEEWYSAGGGEKIQFNLDASTAGEWIEYEYMIDGLVSGTATYSWFAIESSNGIADNSDFYIDDIEFCPADPAVNFSNARLAYDGAKIEVRFNNAMKVPATTAITVKVDGLAVPVTSVETKQGDATSLVLTMTDPITDAGAVITVSGGGSSLKSLDNRDAEIFTNKQVLNLYHISVTTGWRDDFEDETDYITLNIGGGADYTMTEDEVAGIYTVVIDGGVEDPAWQSLDITTFVDADASKREIMDLTGREIVEIRYKVTSTTSPTGFIRIDFKDKINDRTSDKMALLPLDLSGSWVTETIDMSTSFYRQYTTNPCTDPSCEIGVVDRSNIYQAMFKIIEAEGDAGNNYAPTRFDGTIVFDYISIGSALFLSNVTTEVEENAIVSATSSADGQIFFVPQNTAPILSAMQDSVFAGRGVVVDATADVEANISTVGLKANYYWAYAYDPLSGAISSKVGVQINDVTSPIITDATSGDIPIIASTSVTVNEDAKVYVIPGASNPTTLTQVLATYIYSFNVSADLPYILQLSNISSLAVGDVIKFIAIDPGNNLSNISSPSITLVNPTLTMDVTYTENVDGNLPKGNDITIETNIEADVYLVPSSVAVSSIADLTGNAVATGTTVLTGSDYIYTMATGSLSVGNYYMYAVDAADNTKISNPSQLISIVQDYITLVGLSTNIVGTFKVNEGSTKTLQVIYNPADATDKALVLTPSDTDIFTAAVTTPATNSTPAVITITGVAKNPTTQTLTIEGADGTSVTVDVLVECNVAAPVISNDAITACAGDLSYDAFTATASGTITWYEGTVPQGTGPSFNPGESTAAVYTYTATNTVGCESDLVATATLTINALPTAAFSSSIGDVCSDQVIDLTAYATGGTFSGTGVTGTVFTPATVVGSTYSIDFTVTDGTCSATDNETGAITTTPPALTEVTAPDVIAINGVTPYDPLVATPTDVAYSIEWYNATGTTLLFSGASFAHGETGGGPYTYKVRQVNGTCTSPFYDVQLTFSDCDINPPTVNTVEACAGDASIDDLVVTPATGNTVTWYSDEALQNEVSTNTTFAHGVSTTTSFWVTQTGHCTSEPTKATVTINPKPTITWTNLPTQCSNGTSVILSGYVNNADSFSGDGVTAGILDPTAVTGSTTVITATYLNTTTGCSNTANKTVTINAAPSVSFTAPAPMCADALDINLNTATYVTPTGGVFDFGTLPMTGSTFKPSAASTSAPNTVEYTYTTPEGCSAMASDDITVNPLPVVNFTAIGDVCVTGGAINLSTYVDLAGGAFSGSGVTGSSFDPTGLTGSKTISYTVSVNGCSTIATSVANITTTPAPVALPKSGAPGSIPDMTATGTDIKWYNDAMKSTLLYSGTPFAHGSTVSTSFFVTQTVGGCESTPLEVSLTVTDCADPSPTANGATACFGNTATEMTATGTNLVWYSDAVGTQVGTGTSFTPTGLTAIGQYTYYVTQNDNCESAPTAVTYEIRALPSVDFNDPGSVCPDGGILDLTAFVSETGGEFSGLGVSTAGAFDPTAHTTTGDKSVSYTYVDAYSCSTTIDQVVTINEKPVITISPIDDVCFTGGSVSLASYINTAAQGGDFGGSSAITAQGLFNPTLASAGANTISYTFTETATGCSATETATVNVTVVTPPTTANQSSTVPFTQIEATGTNITWYLDASATSFLGTGSPYIYTVDQTTTFYATDANASGCESTPKAVTYTVSSCTVAEPTLAAVNGELEICFNDTWSGFEATSTETAPSFKWYSDANLSTPVSLTSTYNPTISTAAPIQVWVTQTTTCTSPAASIELIVNPLPAVSFSAVPDIDLNLSTANVDLSAYVQTTPGGVFSSANADLSGTNNAIMNPNNSQASNLVTYTVSNSTTGCSNSANRTIKVIGATVISVSEVLFNDPSVNVVDGGAGASFDVSSILNIQPTDAFVKSTAYSVSNTAVASIDAAGVVTANEITVGTTASTTILVDVTTEDALGNDVVVRGTITLNVTKAAKEVTSIVIPTTKQLAEGSTYTFTSSEITVNPLNATDKTVTWSLVSGTGGTINPSTGLITITGTAANNDVFVVMATANDAGAKESNLCTITVIEQVVPITGITSAVFDVTSINVGEKAILTINASPTDATQLNFSLSSSVNGAVTFNKIDDTTWEITGVFGADDLEITITSIDNPSITKKVSLDVIEPVSSIIINQPTTDLTIGGSVSLQTSIVPSTATNQGLLWTSSNEAIATVDANGKVTGVSEGDVTITATAADQLGASQTIDLNVVKVSVNDITATPSSYTVEIGKSITIAYTVNPSNASDKRVTFTSADDDIATVSAGGVVTGVSYDATALEGNTTITIASVDNPSVTKLVTITVIPVQVDKTELYKQLDTAYVIYIELAENPDLFAEKIGSGAGQIPLSTWREFEDIFFAADAIGADKAATQDEVDAIAEALKESLIEMGFVNPDVVGIVEKQANVVNIYPVPFDNELTVEASQIISIRIYDGANKLVLNQKVGADEINIQTTDFSVGNYFIQVITKQGITIKKAIKK